MAPRREDTDDVLDYLLPDRRACFEVAARTEVDGGLHGVDSPFLRRAYRAARIRALSERLCLADGPPDAVARHHEWYAEVRTWPDERLTHVTLARIVAAERILRFRAAHRSPVRPIGVPDPVYAGVADLVTLRAGLAVADRLIGLIHDLSTGSRLPEIAHLASLTALALAGTDPETARTLVATTAAAARTADRPLDRALALAHLGAATELDADNLLDEAAAVLDGELRDTERTELLAVLYPSLARTRLALACRLLSAAVRTGWPSAMALLEWTAASLVDAYGADLVDGFATALTRAAEFH